MNKIFLFLLILTKIISQIDYETQVQPIFDNNCTSCHNYGGSGGLDLSFYSGVMTNSNSGPAIVVGDHENSQLYIRITLPESNGQSMPPSGSMSSDEINIIAQWIDEGALQVLSNQLGNEIPNSFALDQNYPNPFNPTTNIQYSLQKESYVTVNIYDVVGKQIKTLVNRKQDMGDYSLQWNATNNYGEPISAGMYIYTIRAGKFHSSKKMVLLK